MTPDNILRYLEHGYVMKLQDQIETAEYIRNLQKSNETLRQALAQPEQEPVAIHCPSCLHFFSIVPVAKREWVGLTDDERNEMIGRIQHDQFTRQRDLIGKTQIITEMYLKERNT